MDAQAAYSASQVFTFCGHIADDDMANLKSGYVVADTPLVAISSMQEFGFAITAISSLAEVKETIDILELIAKRDSTIDPTEYIDLSNDNSKVSATDATVFTFVGYYRSDQRVLKVGFALAPDSGLLCNHLQQHQFTVHSVTSLGDLRDAVKELEAIAMGRHGEDDCNCLNLLLSS